MYGVLMGIVSISTAIHPILSSQGSVRFGVALIWVNHPLLFGMLPSVVPLEYVMLHI